MALDHNFGAAKLSREQVVWPGSAEQVREWVQDLQQQWRLKLEQSSEEELRGTERTRWPIQDRPLADVFAWANLELMKNAAEIGYARFLYAARPQ